MKQISTFMSEYSLFYWHFTKLCMTNTEMVEEKTGQEEKIPGIFAYHHEFEYSLRLRFLISVGIPNS